VDEAKLTEIEREIAVGWTLPGRADAFALNTMTALVAEVRRLRELLRGVQETFDGCDPVGPPLCDDIRAALLPAGPSR
jgi:hypothetical protein